MSVNTHPFDALTPDAVLDALSSIGLWGDGRLTTLNSFESRVYQVHLDSAVQTHEVVVVKFYRPGRWTDAQIARGYGAQAMRELHGPAGLGFAEDTFGLHKAQSLTEEAPAVVPKRGFLQWLRNRA